MLRNVSDYLIISIGLAVVCTLLYVVPRVVAELRKHPETFGLIWTILFYGSLLNLVIAGYMERR